MALDIIGAGFGRTGTMSLKVALERLGYSKCYHMIDVMADPEHVGLWRAAWRGDDPWERIFDGYAAAVDWPAAAFWPRLMAFYPQAKVLLTVRDAKRWYKSARDTIFQSLRDSLRSPDAARRKRARMAHEIIVDGTFGGDLDDPARAIAIYEANVARVYSDVPADRLIVFDPKDGWQPLCEALGVAPPDEPYPHVNTTAEFHERWGRNAPSQGAAASR